MWADGSFAPPVETEKPPPPDATTPATASPPRGRRRTRDPLVDARVSDDGKLAVASARSADNKDRWFVTLDPETGKTKVIDTLHDEAWVRELAVRRRRRVEFLPDNKRVWFLSERDGWMHLYTLDVTAEGAKPKQLTTGKWEITSPSSRATARSSTSRPPRSSRRAAPLHVSVDGGARTKITSMTGSNEARSRPTNPRSALVYSYSNKPPEVYVMPNRPARPATQVTTTPTEEWRAFNWIDPKVITYKARDGVDVYARLFTPR